MKKPTQILRSFVFHIFFVYWNLCVFHHNPNVYCPGPDSDFSINFFLAKHNHHLLGLPSSPNTLSQTRMPVSWRICCKYWRIKSETHSILSIEIHSQQLIDANSLYLNRMESSVWRRQSSMGNRHRRVYRTWIWPRSTSLANLGFCYCIFAISSSTRLCIMLCRWAFDRPPTVNDPNSYMDTHYSVKFRFFIPSLHMFERRHSLWSSTMIHRWYLVQC